MSIGLRLLEFVAITVPVAWWWIQMGGREATWKIFIQVSAPILVQMGVVAFSGSLVMDRLLGVLPFFALMVITPGISLRKKTIRIACGFLILYVAYVMLAYWAWYTHDREGVDRFSKANYFPVQNIVDGLPFVLWALFSREFISQKLVRYLPAPAAGAPASQPAADALEPERAEAEVPDAGEASAAGSDEEEGQGERSE